MDRLDRIRLFDRVVETGSFSEGAWQEGVSQSTVSKITTLPRPLTLVSLLDVGLNDDTVVGLDFLLLNAGMVGSKERVLTAAGIKATQAPLIGHHQLTVAAHRYLQASAFGTDVSGQFFASAPKKFTGPIEAMRYPHLHDRANQEAAWQESSRSLASTSPTSRHPRAPCPEGAPDHG
jgi:hypothetical protein